MNNDYVMYSDALVSRVSDKWGMTQAQSEESGEYIEFNCRVTLELSGDLYLTGDLLRIAQGPLVTIGVRLDEPPPVECFVSAEFERLLISHQGQTLCMHPVLDDDLATIRFDLADPMYGSVVWLNFSLERSYLEHG